MSLDAALAIAAGGLANINSQFAIVSQNVANAGTAGYAREISTQQAMTADGQPMGVRTGPAVRLSDDALDGDVLLQNAAVAGLQTRQSALSGIDAALGQPGNGSDLGSLLGNLQNAFSSLENDPSNQTQQGQVVAAAGGLAHGINSLAASYGSARQAAQDSLVSEVASLNAGLQTIGSLTGQITRLSVQGQSTADLENQRAAAMQSVSQLIDIRFLPQSNGGLLALAGNGVAVPLDAPGGPFSIAGATLGPQATYPTSAPALLMNGADVTRQIDGGQIGANLALRDQTLPTDQAELDEFAQNLASRFDAQGLRLFSDGSGNVPAGGGVPVQAGYVGFANSIQVNPAVLATPSLVRDGTQAIVGSTTGASSFTPNPPGGPAGFTALITRVLDYTFGADAQTGVAQPASNTAGLGPAGTLAAPYASPATLAGEAASLVGAQAADSAQAAGDLSTEQAVQTTLQGKASAVSGVSVDAEMTTMVQLQNAYSANARIIATAQAMWQDLITAIPPTVG